MVGSVASRSAGFKLATIVMSLMLPVIVLGFFLIKSLNEDINITKNEIDGVKLNNLMRPILVGAVSKDLPEAEVEAYLTEGRLWAQATGGVESFDKLAAALQSPQRDFALINRLSMEAIAENGDSSGLILDPESRTYYLAASSVSYLPTLVRSFADMQQSADKATEIGRMSDERRMQLLINFGLWRESFNRLDVTLHTAEKVSDTVPFSVAATSMQKLKNRIAEVDGLLTAGTFELLPLRIKALPQFSTDQKAIYDDMLSLWTATSSALEAGLVKREEFLSNRLWMVTAGSLIACLIGIGSSIYMFRTTLRRLDDVQETNLQLEASRNELQAMSDKMVEVNNGVTNLNVELASKMKALTAAQDEIVKRGKMSQLGQLTATVAHELRNPLGSVRTSAFVVERKLKDADPSIRNALARISNGVIRCDSIITQLLDFSRSGSLVKKRAVLDDWLANAVQEEANKLPANIDVQLNLGLENTEAAFDAPRLSRAIINLVSNASEAMVGKGEKEEATTQNPIITIQTRATKRGYEIAITDNGPGIPAENQTKIFDPLFTTKSFGTGLGLPAVENIMREHGGGMELKSEVGKGSTFTLWLPAETPAEVSELKTA
jgi:signal transduction histidine kinase